MSTIFNIKVQNKSGIFPAEIGVKTLYFIITASFILKMARNAETALFLQESLK